MKKTKLIIIAILLTIVLFACNGTAVTHDDIFKHVEIGYQENDSRTSVTKNITLPMSVELFPDYELIWESDREDVISIENETGIVTQPNEIIIVNLDVYLTINQITKSKSFTVVVLAKENTELPTIYGANDLYLTLDGDEPDYLFGIFAKDYLGVNIAVEMIENTVDISKTGTYHITYKAVDGRGLIQTKTINVYVMEEEAVLLAKIQADHANLAIETVYSVDSSLVVPTIGDNGSTIEWEFNDPTDPNNEYIDLETFTITVPQDIGVTVVLKAKLSLYQFELEKVFELIIGEVPITIQAALNKQDETSVFVKGVVTTFYTSNNLLHLFIQDDTSGTYVTAPTSFGAQIEVGYEIAIKGIKKTNGGQKYLEVDQSVLKLEAKVIDVNTISANQINSHLGKMVNLRGLLKQVYTNESEFILATETTELKLWVPNGVATVLKEQLYQKPAGVNVDIIAPVWQNGLVLTNHAELEVDEGLNSDLILSYLDKKLAFPKNDSRHSNDISLVKDSDLPFGLKITWSSSNPTVVSNQGEVVQQNERVYVTLTFTIYDVTNTPIIVEDIELSINGLSSYQGNYYDSINFNSDTLLLDLRALLNDTLSLKTYGESRYILDDTDRDPNNSNNVILIYNRASVSGVWNGSTGAAWNREHVYPQSRLGTDATNSTRNIASDLHNLKPANPSINSSRGNKIFVDKPGGGSFWAYGDGYYPGDEDRGDVARIIFYMHVTWSLPISGNGPLNTLLKWHEEDEPDAFEINRNDVIYDHQGNRNPFIDHPHLATILFGEVQLSSGETIIIEIMVYETDLSPFRRKNNWKI
ncbi:MAG: endonuclease [Acholeplasmataceae bacterium]